MSLDTGPIEPDVVASYAKHNGSHGQYPHAERAGIPNLFETTTGIPKSSSMFVFLTVAYRFGTDPDTKFPPFKPGSEAPRDRQVCFSILVGKHAMVTWGAVAQVLGLLGPSAPPARTSPTGRSAFCEL